jgi:molybdate transport system substrate-binding protein
MDQLQQRALIVAKSRRNILSNSLVIIIPSDSARKISSPQDLTDRRIRHIALAEPQAVPAGIYAMQYLREAGVWDRIVDRIVPTDNVRSALAAVESGNADVGIVYKTDARISHLVKVAYTVPAGEGPKVSYPAAVVTESEQKIAAQQFLNYLQTDAARAIFRRYGFILP